MAEESNTSILVRFEGRLRDALELYKSGDNGGRVGALAAVNAVLEFVLSIERLRRDGLIVPLAKLSSALSDLDEGVVSPMLKAARQSGGTAQSMVRQGLRAYAVLTLDILQKTGLSRREAAGLVAKTLNECGVKPLRGRRRDIAATTVINWRDSISADFGEGFAAETFGEMKRDISINPRASAEDVRTDVLKRLRSIALTFRAADEGHTLADERRAEKT